MAHLGKSVVWLGTDLLLAWHLHVVARLSGGVVGVLLMGCMVLGAVSTFAVGGLLSRPSTSTRRLIHVQFAGAVLTATGFVAQFTATDVASLIASGALFRVGYAFYDVPQNALTSILPEDRDDTFAYARIRTSVSAAVRLFVTGAYVLAGTLARPEPGLLAGVAAIAVTTAGGLYFVRHPGLSRKERSESKARDEPLGWRNLAVLVIASSVLLPTNSRLIVFTPAQPGWPQLAGAMLCAFCVGVVFGPVALRRIVERIGFRSSMVLFAIVSVGTSIAQVLPGASGWLRLQASILQGVSYGALSAVLWAEIARYAQHDAAVTGIRRDAGVFGRTIAGFHVANGLGAMLVGPLIEGVEAGRTEAGVLAVAATSLGALVTARLLATR